MKIFNKEKQPEEPYLALIIGENKVKSGIWVFKQGIGEPLSVGTAEKWNGESQEELIVAADTSIASAVNKLSEISSFQPSKLILGLPENWTEENTVKDFRSKMLQAVCRKILLTPQGFVVTPEAIAHYLKKEEGDLLSVILLSLEESEITVSLVVQGKIYGSQIVGRSNNLALDLEEALIRFEYSGTLPPRILLFNGSEKEEAKQNLVAYPWVSPEKQKKISFLQLPRVDFAPEDLEVKAVIFAGSRDLALGKGLKKEEKPSEKKIENEIKTEETVIKTEESFPAEEILEDKPEEILENDFGFLENEDIALKNDQPESLVSGEIINNSKEEVSPLNLAPPPQSKKTISFGKRNFFNKVFDLLKKTGRKITGALSFLKTFLFRRGILALFSGLAVVFGLFIFFYLQVVKFQVKLFVQPAVIEKEIEFFVSQEAKNVDFEKKTIPAIEEKIEVSGSKNAEVKGRKTVGEKATGEIVIYNGTDKKKILAKGSAIKGPDGLKFLLSEGIEIGPRTTDFNSSPPVDKWGEGKVAVSAADIGTQYNLAANSAISLESDNSTASSILIRNLSDFSGGTSREISAVSKEDRESLQVSLLSELQQQAKEQIKNKTANAGLLEDSFELKNKIDQFDHEVGDEASNLSLEEKAEFAVYYFNEDDLKMVIEKEVESQVPEGYSRNPAFLEKSYSLKDKKENSFIAKTSLKYYPDINVDDITRQLKGKFFKKAKMILNSVKFAAGYEIKVNPQIFSFLPVFPIKTSSITLTLEPI